VGLSVYGNRVDYVVPGGPAHLSRQLAAEDEIVQVDGKAVSDAEVPAAIVGSDLANSTVQLLVRKADTGRVITVELVRVPKESMANMVRLFEMLTQIKQNGHNNAEFEKQYASPAETTSVLLDKVVTLISLVQYEEYDKKGQMRRHFEQLYDEMRARLAEAYEELDQMELKMGPNNKHKQQAEKLAVELESLRNAFERLERENKKLRSDLARELGHEHELEDELHDYAATHHLSDKDVANLMRELGHKKEELAKEYEKSMQRDFEMRRLQTSCDMIAEELQAANHSIVLKDDELRHRSLEDKDIEKKILALQQHLEQAIDESQKRAEEAEELRELLEKKTSKEMEGLKSLHASLEEEHAARIAELETQIRDEDEQVKKREKRIEELQVDNNKFNMRACPGARASLTRASLSKWPARGQHDCSSSQVVCWS